MQKAIQSEIDPPSNMAKPSLIWNFAAPALLMAFLVVLGMAGQTVIWPLSTADGTYQTYGMLDRIANGDLPGISHVPYLGILLSYALAPFFLALGQSVFAAFAAAQIAVQICWCAALVSVFWATGSDRRAALRQGLNTFVILYLLYLPLAPHGILPELQFAYSAGGSLLFMRDCAGVILALATCGISDPTLRRRCMAAGSGALAFWSPASGVALLIVSAMLFVSGEVTGDGPPKARFARMVASLAGMVLAMVATATLLSAGHPFGLIDRVFLAAGDNQLWFFGPFDDRSRLLSLRDVGQYLVSGSWPILSMYIGLAAFAWNLWSAKLFSRRGDALALICLTPLASGWISQIGGHVEPHYFYSFAIMGVANCATLVFRAWQRISDRVTFVRYAYLPGSLFLLPGLRTMYRFARGLILPIVSTGHPQPSFWLAEAGMAFPQGARKDVEFLRQQRAEMDHRGVPGDRRMIASYYAWPNILLGSTPPPRFNSIIHLMTAADRREFRDYFVRQRPEWVATLDLRWEDFEYWNVRSNWSFYREVVKHYRPAYGGTAELYWHRADRDGQPLENQTATQAGMPVCKIVRVDRRRIELRIDGPTPSAGIHILDMRISYSADPGRPGGWRGDFGRGYLRVADRSSGLLLQLQGRTRKTIYAGIDASPGIWFGLPSGQQTAEIPVEHLGDRRSTLLLEMQGGETAGLEVGQCEVMAILPDPFATLNNPGVITDLK